MATVSDDYYHPRNIVEREVRDKIGIVFHGCHRTTLEREADRKRSEDFLIELFGLLLREANENNLTR